MRRNNRLRPLMIVDNLPEKTQCAHEMMPGRASDTERLRVLDIVLITSFYDPTIHNYTRTYSDGDRRLKL